VGSGGGDVGSGGGDVGSGGGDVGRRDHESYAHESYACMSAYGDVGRRVHESYARGVAILGEASNGSRSGPSSSKLIDDLTNGHIDEATARVEQAHRLLHAASTLADKCGYGQIDARSLATIRPALQRWAHVTAHPQTELQMLSRLLTHPWMAAQGGVATVQADGCVGFRLVS